MKLGFGVVAKEWFFPSLIIQNLGKIIEHIHGIRYSDPTIEYIHKVRGDAAAADMLKRRGVASHYAPVGVLDFEMWESFVKEILE